MESRVMTWTSLGLAIILLFLLLDALPGAVSAQSPGGEVIYSTEYMNASQALQDATLQDDEIQREQLLREAVQWYTADLEKRSTDVAVTYNNRAVAYARLGEYELAIADYNVALELSPRSADFIKNRGLAYEQMGNLEGALADFKAFLDMIADMPSARREEEYLYFSDKVAELSGKVEGVNIQEEITSEKSPILPEEGDIVPLWWAWIDYYGNAKTHNDTYPYPGGSTTPNLSGWKCEAFYPGHKIENAVWFQLPPITGNRTAHNFNGFQWSQVFWDHYYASVTGWTPHGSNTYYLQIPNRQVCLGYSPSVDHHKIHAYVRFN